MVRPVCIAARHASTAPRRCFGQLPALGVSLVPAAPAAAQLGTKHRFAGSSQSKRMVQPQLRQRTLDAFSWTDLPQCCRTGSAVQGYRCGISYTAVDLSQIRPQPR